MGSSNKYTPKITTALSAVVLLLHAAGVSANALPNPADIQAAAEKARLTLETFKQQSFELRMKYEYSGKFQTEEDKENLRKLAKRASDDLHTIAENQRKLKQQIEDYQGEDWDERYGVTGLWRKLSTDLYATKLAKCEIDYYFGLTVDWSVLNKTLKELREEIISLDTVFSSANSRLLRAKILALAKIDSAWNVSATDILNSLMDQASAPEAIYFRAAIERLKLAHLITTEPFDALVQEITQSSCADDFELILSLASLRRRYDPNGLEKTVSLWPQTEDFLGSLALADLSHRFKTDQLTEQNLQKVGVFEAELAAGAAWKDKAHDHKILLYQLSNTEKLQTPLILYVTALAFADTSPAKAVNLLVEASRLSQSEESSKLNIEPFKIAEQAAQLAYNLFAEDSTHCELVLEAFENYCTAGGEKLDERLEYLYSTILNNCGFAEESKELLQQIADRPSGRWRNRAKFELTVNAIRQKQYNDPEQKSRLLRQFSSLIVENKDCEHIETVKELLSEVIDETEAYEAKTGGFNEMMQDFKKTARFCYDCSGDQQSSLLLAEVCVLAAGKDKVKLSEAEKLLDNITQNTDVNDVDFVRCRARLLSEQGKFDEAAGLWAQVAEMRENKSTAANQKSWKWWRAKFYELHCWAQCPQTKNKDVLHTIEVLENSFADIPALWTEKLNSLKQQIE
ncbi:MAG: hypothetical protein JSV99_05525 [Planctomycetota bacterium]|nr:MAG: hypothetical protein JSV99_05525 [Planctomycetota bacterium]